MWIENKGFEIFLKLYIKFVRVYFLLCRVYKIFILVFWIKNIRIIDVYK